MIPDALAKTILELNEKAKADAANYSKKRFAYGEIFGGTGPKTMVGIAGLRGAGKSVMLKQKLVETKDSLYVSLDALEQVDLYALAEYFSSRYGVKAFFFDEIHYCKNWQQGLKKIYDFLGAKVYFTSSVAIDIVHAPFDLGRRAIVKKLHPFSFREYLFFTKGISIGKADWKTLDDAKALQEMARHEYLFEEYLSGGLLPAFLGEKNPEIFAGIAMRVIERDLVFSMNFTGEDIYAVKKILEFAANSPVEDISYSSLAKNTGITKYHAMKYVDCLQKAFLLNVILPAGSNVVKEPKILFVPPFRLVFAKDKDPQAHLGALREDFFAESLAISGTPLHYVKGVRGEKAPDYLVTAGREQYFFEVGGKSKTAAQIAGSLRKAKKAYLLVHPARTDGLYRPLIFAGFLA